jgi:hypothetical protein
LQRIILRRNNTIDETKSPNNTFIDRKQCPLSSSRGKSLADKCSIRIIIKEKILIPSTPIYTKSIYPKEQSRGRPFKK